MTVPSNYLINLFFINKDHQWHCLNHINNFFYFLAVILKPDFVKAHRLLSRIAENAPNRIFTSLLAALSALKQNNRDDADAFFTEILWKLEERPQLLSLFIIALFNWVNLLLLGCDDANLKKQKKPFFYTCLEYGCLLPAHLSAEVEGMCRPDEPEHQHFLKNQTPFHTLRFLNLVTFKPAWEATIDKLSELILKKSAKASSPNAKRMVWFVDTKKIDFSL